MRVYMYTRRPDALAARDKDNGSGDGVGVRGTSKWSSCGRGVKREIGKHSSDVFQDGRRWPLDPPHTLYHCADETSALVSRSDSPSNNDLLRNATATAASLLFSFCLCIYVYACVCGCANVYVSACQPSSLYLHRLCVTRGPKAPSIPALVIPPTSTHSLGHNIYIGTNVLRRLGRRFLLFGNAR